MNEYMCHIARTICRRASIISVFSIASLFKYLFNNYPLFIWAFFFGLILISILYVGKTIKKWTNSTYLSLVFGIVFACYISNISI